MADPAYKRILLKLSGEALAGSQGFGFDPSVLNHIAREVKAVHDLGCQLGIVVGGGNIIRGEAFSADGGIDRTAADHMGMLGTIINGLAIQAALERHGVPTRVQSAIAVDEVCEPFIRRRAIRHLEKGRVVVFGGGTGNPYFTTDTAGVLRALEIEADVIIKATKVDGIYTADPRKDPDAKRYERLTFDQTLEERLGVMDMTAFTLCRENSLPVLVLDMFETGAMATAASGGSIGTLVTIS